MKIISASIVIVVVLVVLVVLVGAQDGPVVRHEFAQRRAAALREKGNRYDFCCMSM